MSNDLPNPPMPPPAMEPPRPRSMLQTWIDAVTKPSEATYASMASSPNATSTTAFIWVFVVSLVESFILYLVQGARFRALMEQQGLGGQLPSGGIAGSIIGLICGAPIAAVISVVAFAIGVGLIQWIARMFGGRGTFGQLAYVLAAIAVPIGLISTVLGSLAAIPVVGLCFGLLSILLFLYTLYLDIAATKGVHQFGWGPAAGSVLIPFAVLLLIACCLAIAFGALVSAALGSVFSSLGPLPIPTP